MVDLKKKKKKLTLEGASIKRINESPKTEGLRLTPTAAHSRTKL